MLKARHILVCGAISTVLAACATAAPAPLTMRERPLAEQAMSVHADCVGRLKAGELRTHVDEAHCENDAFAVLPAARNYPFPDLSALLAATRLSIADRLDKQEISEAQGSVEFERARVEVNSEAYRRLNAAAARQDAAAARADAERARLLSILPTTCATNGSVTTCF